jgi:hypothetical protein
VIVHSFAGDDVAACLTHLGVEGIRGRPMTSAEADRERQARSRQEFADRARKLEHCQRVWSEAVEVNGSLSATYLAGRSITGSLPGSLRFHGGAPRGYDAPSFGPAMVAKVTDREGYQIGLHLTFLRPDGLGKADVERPKLMFGQVTGGAVRLHDGPVGGTLALAEGIESALSYSRLKGVLAWACLSAIGLERVDLPSNVRRVIVAADGDETGQRAARALRERLSRRCEVALDPAPTGRDWNDVLEAA